MRNTHDHNSDKKSKRRESNPQHSGWKPDALPIELLLPEEFISKTLHDTTCHYDLVLTHLLLVSYCFLEYKCYNWD